MFLSHDTRRVCEQLGIEKKEIKKGRPYQNYIEAAFGVQRRMADWSFEKAHTWEDLLAAHDDRMTQAIEDIVQWVAADRSEKGDSHKADAADKADAWFMIHVVGALIVRLVGASGR